MNADEDALWPEKNLPLSRFYAYKNTFNENDVWLDVPEQRDHSLSRLLAHDSKLTFYSVTFVNISNPYLESGTPEPDDHQLRDPAPNLLPELQPSSPEALSAAALYSHAEADNLSQPNNEQETSPILLPSMVSLSNDWNLLLSPASLIDSPTASSLMSSEAKQTPPSSSGTAASQKMTQRPQQECEAESEHNVAFLLRHFSESPGHWYVTQRIIAKKEAKR